MPVMIHPCECIVVAPAYVHESRTSCSLVELICIYVKNCAAEQLIHAVWFRLCLATEIHVPSEVKMSVVMMQTNDDIFRSWFAMHQARWIIGLRRTSKTVSAKRA